MKHILVIACMVALGSSACAHGQDAESRAMDAVDKAFGPVEPSAYELDYSEKCELLKARYSKGFEVVIPACVVLGFDNYK